MPPVETDLTLERYYLPGTTFGTLRAPGLTPFRTVECPWNDNRTGLSCVPEGCYEIQLDFFERGGYPAYELVSVPGRSRILIHAANEASELAGCIAVGLRFGCLQGRWAVLESRPALRALMAWLDGRPGRLTIQRSPLGSDAGPLQPRPVKT